MEDEHGNTLQLIAKPRSIRSPPNFHRVSTSCLSTHRYQNEQLFERWVLLFKSKIRELQFYLPTPYNYFVQMPTDRISDCREILTLKLRSVHEAVLLTPHPPPAVCLCSNH